MNNAYSIWRRELASPTPEDQRLQRETAPQKLAGFWRIQSARTKPDHPVAIWPQDGSSGNAIFFKIGVGARDGESLFDTVSAEERVDQFFLSTWLHCAAVTEAEYHQAMASGRWSDGKPARHISTEEKLDIVPDTPAAAGGNNPDSADAFHEQIVTKIEAALERVKTLPFPFTSLDDANKAADVVETLRGLGKQGEAKRKEQKQPFLDGAAEVDARWSIVRDASDAVKRIVDAVESFKKAETARLRREQDGRDRKERERLRIEAEERARQEADAAAREALARGEAFEEPTPEAIAEQAEAAADEAMAAAPAPEISVRVGTAHGRAIATPKVRKARIINVGALAKHFVDAKDADFIDYLSKRANAAARAKITLPGTELEE